MFSGQRRPPHAMFATAWGSPGPGAPVTTGLEGRLTAAPAVLPTEVQAALEGLILPQDEEGDFALHSSVLALGAVQGIHKSDESISRGWSCWLQARRHAFEHRKMLVPHSNHGWDRRCLVGRGGG